MEIKKIRHFTIKERRDDKIGVTSTHHFNLKNHSSGKKQIQYISNHGYIRHD